MTFYEQMVPALSTLLEKDETLKVPIYGTLLRKRDHDFGYFGLTDTALLIALLQGDSKKLTGYSRIPLNSIRQAKVKKSLIPLQYKLYLNLAEGTTVKIRVSKKVYGFATQEENLNAFLSQIQRYA